MSRRFFLASKMVKDYSIQLPLPKEGLFWDFDSHDPEFQAYARIDEIVASVSRDANRFEAYTSWSGDPSYYIDIEVRFFGSYVESSFYSDEETGSETWEEDMDNEDYWYTDTTKFWESYWYRPVVEEGSSFIEECEYQWSESSRRSYNFETPKDLMVKASNYIQEFLLGNNIRIFFPDWKGNPASLGV